MPAVSDETFARLDVILEGLSTTLLVAGGALLIALVGSLLLALARRGGSVLRWLATAYVEVIRGTPVLVQLFILYFGLGQVGLRLSSLQAAVLGLGMNGAAYLSEIVRSGIESVHHGELEAAYSVGMTRRQTMFRVVLPQAVRVILPPSGNYTLELLKATAIVSIVAAPEMMFRARQLTVASLEGGEIYLLVAGVYLVLSLPLAFAVRRLEGRVTRWGT